MPFFGERSRRNLAEAHPELHRLFNYVIQTYDCAVICGHRTREAQDDVFFKGTSKVEWPNSKHNSKPSLAVDVVPWPIDWKDEKRLYHFVGYVFACAAHLGIKVRSGADWDGDLNFKDQNFHDAPHWEFRLPPQGG